MTEDRLQDLPCEHYVLSGVYHNGYDGLDEASMFVGTNSFNDGANQALFKCMEHLGREDGKIKYDVPTILSTARDLGYDFLSKPNELKHLRAIAANPVSLSNLRKFAAKLKKTEIRRQLVMIVDQVREDLIVEPSTSSIESVLALAEGPIFDYISNLSNGNDDEMNIADGWEEWIDALAANPRDYVGIPTGLPGFDEAIGGGFRRRAVSMIGARPKTGKSILAMFFALHCISLKIPVLLVDTEMDKDDFRPRIAANLSGVPINKIETGKFGDKETFEAVRNVGKKLRSGSFTYFAGKGRPFEELVSRMRRWIHKKVGYASDGKTNDCLIVYDYFKLTSGNDINQAMQEYQMLGFQMTTLHNFANRFDVPIASFVQLNRDGITKESTDAVSGSDRIIWLASNFSILKCKSAEEINEIGIKHGNRKLVTLASRHGPSMGDNDYLNLHIQGEIAGVQPGKMKSQIASMDDDNDDDVSEQDTIPF